MVLARKEQHRSSLKLVDRGPRSPAKRLEWLMERHLRPYIRWEGGEMQIDTAPKEFQEKFGLLEYGVISASLDSKREVAVRFARFIPDKTLKGLEGGLVGVSHLIGVQEGKGSTLLCVGRRVDIIEAAAEGLEVKFRPEEIVFGRVREGEGKGVVINPPGAVENFFQAVVEMLERRAGEPLLEAPEAGVSDFAHSHAGKAREIIKSKAAKITLGRTMPLVREIFLGQEWVVLT